MPLSQSINQSFLKVTFSVMCNTRESATVLEAQEMEMSSMDNERTLTMVEDADDDSYMHQGSDVNVLERESSQTGKVHATQERNQAFSRKVEGNTETILKGMGWLN